MYRCINYVLYRFCVFENYKPVLHVGLAQLIFESHKSSSESLRFFLFFPMKILIGIFQCFQVREAMEMTLEEDLFAKLVFLYRSPETMIKWSRPKEEEGNEEPRAIRPPPQ